MAFDPYHKWLGIPPSEQPPNHYRLLAIGLFEDDPDVIETAADQRMGHLRTFQTGQYSALSQKLLNELSSAKLCLLSPQKKAGYDAALRHQLEAATQQPTPAAPRPLLPAAQARPADVIPLQDGPSPVVVIDDRPPPRATRSIRRRRANFWPAAGVVALATAMFVGYLIYTKPVKKPSVKVAKNQRVGDQPGKSGGTEKPSRKPPAPKQPAPKQPAPKQPSSKQPSSKQPSSKQPAPQPPAPQQLSSMKPPEPNSASPKPVSGSPISLVPAPETAGGATSTSEDSVPPIAATPKESAGPSAPKAKPSTPPAAANDQRPLDSGQASQKLTAQEAFPLKQHTATVTRLAFHRTLPLLASAGKDGRVLLWNLETRAAAELHKFREEVWAMKFHPDGELLAFANRHWWGSRLVFKTFAGVQLNEIKDFKNGGGAVASIAYSHDGRLFAAGQDDGTIRLWDVAQFREIPPVAFGDGHNVYCLAFGPVKVDRKRKQTDYLLAAGCHDGMVRTLAATFGKSKTNEGWRVQPTAVPFPKAGAVLGVRFSHDGKLLGLTRSGGHVALCDPQTGKIARELAAGGRGVGSAEGIAFHPQLPWCVSAHKDSRVARIWNTASGEQLCELSGHEAGVMCAEFSPDGRRVATASEDLSIRIWDLSGPGVPDAPKRGKKAKLPAFVVGN